MRIQPRCRSFTQVHRRADACWATGLEEGLDEFPTKTSSSFLQKLHPRSWTNGTWNLKMVVYKVGISKLPGGDFQVKHVKLQGCKELSRLFFPKTHIQGKTLFASHFGVALFHVFQLSLSCWLSLHIVRGTFYCILSLTISSDWYCVGRRFDKSWCPWGSLS